MDIKLFIRKKAKGLRWLINVVPEGYKSRSTPGNRSWPPIFLSYINDIAENLLSIVRLFADDTSLACSSASIRDIEGILNQDLLVLSTWRKQWLVGFNPSKTEAILIPVKQNLFL